MTLTQFLRKLKAKTKKMGVTWRITNQGLYDGDLRADYKGSLYCPLWFLAEKHSETDRSMKILKLSEKTGTEIYRAADGVGNLKVRKQLLKAVGLA